MICFVELSTCCILWRGFGHRCREVHGKLLKWLKLSVRLVSSLWHCNSVIVYVINILYAITFWYWKLIARSHWLHWTLKFVISCVNTSHVHMQNWYSIYYPTFDQNSTTWPKQIFAYSGSNVRSPLPIMRALKWHNFTSHKFKQLTVTLLIN